MAAAILHRRKRASSKITTSFEAVQHLPATVTRSAFTTSAPLPVGGATCVCGAGCRSVWRSTLHSHNGTFSVCANVDRLRHGATFLDTKGAKRVFAAVAAAEATRVEPKSAIIGKGGFVELLGRVALYVYW